MPSQLKVAIVAANSISVFADSTNVALSSVYKYEQEECVSIAKTRPEAESCVSKVRAKYRPAWAYYRKLRRAWVMVSSAIRAAQNIKDPNDPRLRKALSDLASARSGFSNVASVLEGSK